MKIAIIGAGYVGLPTAAMLAYFGHEVVCHDVDRAKIECLRLGRVPFFEPGLKEILERVRSRLVFTSEDSEAISGVEAVFIAVGTPNLPNGRPDLSRLRECVEKIRRHSGPSRPVIVNKSTVPIGSGNWMAGLVAGKGNSIVSNPEFLREGSALRDSFYPDRVVLGSDDPLALETLLPLYRPLLEQSFEPPPGLPRPAQMTGVALVTTNLASAELIKYAANSFLALKISFINEMARLAEKVGADIAQVSRAIGLDKRIGKEFLRAGIGWGGSCLGKDTEALLALAREQGLTLRTAEAARQVNVEQREWVFRKVQDALQGLQGKAVGLMGLSFKPQTDDLRDAPASHLAQRLLEAGAQVKVHDPLAMGRAKAEWSGLELKYCETTLELSEESDALLLITEWPEYTDLPWEELARKMRSPRLFDCRNCLDGDRLRKAGFHYWGVGR